MAGEPITIGAGNNGLRSEYEIQWARNRPAGSRTPWPEVGDRVLYRSNEWFIPVSAEIVAVNLDPNSANMMFPDPWPLCRVKVFPRDDIDGLDVSGKSGPRPYLTDTREARLDGSPGWLPLDWEMRERPRFGGM